MKIDINVVDPIECQISVDHVRFIKSCLQFTSVYWQKDKKKSALAGRDIKKRKEYQKSMFSHKTKTHWYFYLGHLPRVLDFCKKNSIIIDIHHLHPHLSWTSPEIKGITFRDDQKMLFNNALTIQRGVIISPTGTGKTLLQLGIVSAFPDQRTLILAHTQAIVIQTVEEVEKHLPQFKVQQIGAGVPYWNNIHGDIVVATMQSFNKLHPEEYCDRFGVVIIDEGHHISKFNGTYANILKNLLSVVRLAFTATLPQQPEAKLALEGLIGPVIGNLTIKEAAKKKIIAKPKVKIIKCQYDQRIKNQRKYPDVYDVGIVNNQLRNSMIVELIMKHKRKGDVVLIFVNKIEHGKNLVKIFRKNKTRVPFVYSDMSILERENIKKSLRKRRQKIAIATTAWKEGIDIPSLNVIVNAGGGKSEVAVLQHIGRGLRRAKNKNKVLIYDFFDPSHFYLISHFGERICIYIDNNWL